MIGKYNYIYNNKYNKDGGRVVRTVTPQITAAEKSKLYSDQLNRFFIFKNKLDFPAHPVAKASVQEAPPTPVEMAQLNEPADVTPRVPATLKSNFLTPPATEEERPKLKRNFFHN